jgi:hypothetical protein
MKVIRISLVLLLSALKWVPLYAQDIENLKNEKPVTFHGSLGSSLLLFSSGKPGEDPQLTWAITGSATLSVYGVQLPFSFSFADKKANYSQPFNQFGLSPKYKWITVHLGYRNVTFSNYTLAGYTFLGAGVELNPGILRFGFIWGRFVKSSTSNVNQSLFEIPVLSRTGYAIKLGLGSSKNFADLIFLKAKDDSTTLKQTTNDSLVAPAANVAFGLNMHFTLAEPLTVDIEGALSLMTNDIRLPVMTDEFSTRMKKLIPVNLSTEYYTALRASLTWQKPLYSLGLSYNRIDPDYKTMGIYFINNDLENITFTPSFYLFKKKFRFSGSAGYQHDNLRKTKRATTMRTIWNLSLAYDPVSWFGFDLSYANFSTSQKAGNIPLTDSLKCYNVSKSFSLNPRLLFVRERHIHSILISYNLNDYIDRNSNTDANTTHATTALLNYSLTFIKSQIGMTGGLSYISSRNSLAETTMYGGSASFGKPFFGNKLYCSLGESVQTTEIASQNGLVFNTNASVRYQPHPKHTFSLQIYFVNNTFSDKNSANAYNQSKGDLSYVFTF